MNGGGAAMHRGSGIRQLRHLRPSPLCPLYVDSSRPVCANTGRSTTTDKQERIHSSGRSGSVFPKVLKWFLVPQALVLVLVASLGMACARNHRIVQPATSAEVQYAPRRESCADQCRPPNSRVRFGLIGEWLWRVSEHADHRFNNRGFAIGFGEKPRSRRKLLRVDH
jgi:hypothetical protein